MFWGKRCERIFTTERLHAPFRFFTCVYTEQPALIRKNEYEGLQIEDSKDLFCKQKKKKKYISRLRTDLETILLDRS